MVRNAEANLVKFIDFLNENLSLFQLNTTAQVATNKETNLALTKGLLYSH